MYINLWALGGLLAGILLVVLYFKLIRKYLDRKNKI